MLELNAATTALVVIDLQEGSYLSLAAPMRQAMLSPAQRNWPQNFGQTARRW